MRTRNWLVLVAAVVVVLLAMDSFYIVNETQEAVLKRFSRIEKTNIQPGIYPKVPLVDQIVRVDGRLLVHELPTQSFLTSEKKRLMVDAFITWRVADVQRYIIAVGAGTNNGAQMERRARQLLDPRIDEALRNQFAKRTVPEIVAGKGGKLPDEALDPASVETQKLIEQSKQLDASGSSDTATPSDLADNGEQDKQGGQEESTSPEDSQQEAMHGPPPAEHDEREKLMSSVAQEVNASTLKDLGIQVVDVRVEKVDWPKQVRGRVFDRMRAERKRDSAEHRAEGREAAERIRASADRKQTEIVAEAYKDAQKLRGEGDAKATGIYAGAYTQDADFFRFYRSLRAYRHSFDSKDDLLILSPDSEFFRFLKSDGSAEANP